MKRFLPLCLLALMLSVLLAACGDKATVPTYAGATSVTAPTTFSDSVKNSIKDVKNAKVDSYKTTDDLSKIKANFTDSFKKGGWDDKNSDLGPDASKTFDTIGGWAILYQKDNSAAAVIGLPGSVAGPAGFTGVGQNENVFIIISADK